MESEKVRLFKIRLIEGTLTIQPAVQVTPATLADADSSNFGLKNMNEFTHFSKLFLQNQLCRNI